MNRANVERLAPWITTLIFLLLWWLVVKIFHIESFVLPSPIEAFAALYNFRYPLAMHGLATLGTTTCRFCDRSGLSA